MSENDDSDLDIDALREDLLRAQQSIHRSREVTIGEVLGEIEEARLYISHAIDRIDEQENSHRD